MSSKGKNREKKTIQLLTDKSFWWILIKNLWIFLIFVSFGMYFSEHHRVHNLQKENKQLQQELTKQEKKYNELQETYGILYNQLLYTSNEVGKLKKSYNELLKILQQKDADLQEISRDYYELKIETQQKLASLQVKLAKVTRNAYRSKAKTD